MALFRRTKQKPWLLGGAGLAVVVLLVGLLARTGQSSQASSFYEVKRGDFLISIVEGGTLEAVSEVSIRNEVEGTARIIFIVPEGTYVKKGDLLVELDSSASQDAVNQQQINVEKAQFGLIQAEQQLEIQKSTAESDIQSARLRVEFAELDLTKFLQGEITQSLRNAQIEITNVLENLAIARERLDWSQKLFKEGFETKSNLDRDRLAVSQTELRLEQAERSLWMLENFDQKKKQRELESARHEANESLDRVKMQRARIIAQFQAEVETQRSTLELSRRKLERDLRQLAATKVYAPQDGLVVYPAGGRFSNESIIEEGAVVRNRQELIKLPDIAEMKLVLRIHESHINQIRRGQPAFVVLDSMPDQRFRGLVSRVGILPDGQSRFGNPNLKVYLTEVLVTDPLPDVKPGVSARAEIVVTNLASVLTAPIQSVTTRQGQQVVFLAGAPQRPVPVSVGMYNTKFIEIISGLKEGDQVLLAPPFDTENQDLGGAVLAGGETVALPDTNQLARLAARSREAQRDAPLAANSPSAPSRPADPSGPSLDAPSAASGTQPPQAEAGQRFVRQEDGPGEGRRGGSPGGERGIFNPSPELLKQFDTNGDGQLDESERAAMRERFNRERRRPGAEEAPTR
jgi:HlyD family secretion protein